MYSNEFIYRAVKCSKFEVEEFADFVASFEMNYLYLLIQMFSNLRFSYI